MNIKELAEKQKEYAVTTRRLFHQYPEIASEEFVTSRMITEELEKIGIPYRVVCETGVIADIEGGKTAKEQEESKVRCVALRADIDALAVKEETGLPFASKHDGKMHACGHDAHIAALLTAAKILNQEKENLEGKIRLIFQPAEEVSGGALRMIGAGALSQVDTIFGLHVWSDIPAGKINVEAGPRMASADFFTIKITGKGCHGAMPQQGVDAIVAGTAVVQSLQTMVSRELSPMEPYILTIGEFHGGSASNVVAEEVIMKGTVRTFNNEVRQKIPEIMERIIVKTAEAYRASGELDYRFGASYLENHKGCSERAEKAAAKIFGQDAICSFPKVGGAEDFSEYLKEVPGVFVFLGAGDVDKDAKYPLHNCRFQIDEEVIHLGAALAVQYAVDFLIDNEKPV